MDSIHIVILRIIGEHYNGDDTQCCLLNLITVAGSQREHELHILKEMSEIYKKKGSQRNWWLLEKSTRKITTKWVDAGEEMVIQR